MKKLTKKGSHLHRASVMVPNLFTVGNMAFGFFAIMATFEERWIAAPCAIFFAHVFDILDGRVARWMGHTSRFGAEFDSFADWISFGLAPAIMIYQLVLSSYGKLGFLLAFFYVLAGALRLARFNVKNSEDEEPNRHFTGLPIPGAGGFIAILILLFGLFENGHQGKTMDLLYRHIPFLMQVIPLVVFSLSLLMISKVQYSNFKTTRFVRPKSIRAFLITLLVIFLVYAYPQNSIFLMYLGYILWGIINTGIRTYRLKRNLENR